MFVALVFGQVERAPGNARIGILRIADDAGFVDCLAGQAKVGGGGLKSVPVSDTFRAAGSNLPPLLRRIVFVRLALFADPSGCSASCVR